MSFKKVTDFLKPTASKLIIYIFALILAVFLSILFTPVQAGGLGGGTAHILTPGLSFISIRCVFVDGVNVSPGCVPKAYFEINYLGLLLNLLFWYLVSCALSSAYKKYKK